MKYDFIGFENHVAAEQLKQGKIGKLIGIGNSMTPILKSKQPVICIPITNEVELHKNDIVFCKVNGHYYLHKVYGVRPNQFLIGNNHGHMNGWTQKKNIFGKVAEIL